MIKQTAENSPLPLFGQMDSSFLASKSLHSTDREWNHFIDDPFILPVESLVFAALYFTPTSYKEILDYTVYLFILYSHSPTGPLHRCQWQRPIIMMSHPVTIESNNQQNISEKMILEYSSKYICIYLAYALVFQFGLSTNAVEAYDLYCRQPQRGAPHAFSSLLRS